MTRPGFRIRFALLLLLSSLWARAQEPGYRIVTDPAESAQPVALEILKHLAAGELERAAALSNAPERRLETLRQFRSTVGEEQFKRLFGRFFSPENRIVMEAAIGEHRLLVWELGEAERKLAGQYYVAAGGRFLMDDVPSERRAELQRVLDGYRKQSGR